MKTLRKSMSLIVLLISVLFVGCGVSKAPVVSTAPEVTATATPVVYDKPSVQTFCCNVEYDGTVKTFDIPTVNKDGVVYDSVGAALLDAGLIAGDESEYGLYIKTVDGVLADYNVDQTYWAFYVDGEYALKGVDQTPIAVTSVYSLVKSK